MSKKLNNSSENLKNCKENNKDSTKIEKSLNNRDEFLYRLNSSWIGRNSLNN